jgi:thiosulfate dehydrogenase [quinone] large subunit
MRPAAENRIESDYALAYFGLRATLGVNILFHGFSRILSGNLAFAANMVQQFHGVSLPAMLVRFFGLILPWTELILGAFILAGAFTRLALAAGAALILLLTFGSALHQDWTTTGIQLIYALVYAVLIAFHRYNTRSLDARLQRRTTTAR